MAKKDINLVKFLKPQIKRKEREDREWKPPRQIDTSMKPVGIYCRMKGER